MDALDICYHLRRLGKSQAQIARELNVTQSVVGNVINNRITAHEVATYIARLLDRKVEDLWPGRYTYKPRGPSANRRRPHLASIDTKRPDNLKSAAFKNSKGKIKLIPHFADFARH